MADKILQTRIRQKIDNYSTWASSSIILGAGEYAAVTVGADDSAPVPQGTYIKIGNGTSNFSALPFISATDPTIPSWAKAQNKPTYQASEIQGLEEFIAGEINDTNTTYQMVKVNEYQFKLQYKNVGDPDWTDAFTLDIPNDTDAIEALETLVGNTAVSTQISNAIDAAKEALVATVAAGDNSITVAGTATNPTVAVKISKDSGNALSVVNDGLKVTVPASTDYTVQVTESSPEGYAKAYTITQASTGLNTTINIPKDMVVQSGTVETDPEEQEPGTYLVLTLANATSDKIYINVGSLIEYVTSGSEEGDQIFITISPDHKVTATLATGSVTKEQLVSTVQTTLNKADSALQSGDITTGSANGTIAVKGSDITVTGLKSAAFSDATAFENAGAAAAVKAEVIGTAADVGTTDTIKGAKKYADGLITNLNTVDSAVEKQFVTQVSQTNGKISVLRAAVANIALSGSTDDLVQGINTLILNCGGATE